MRAFFADIQREILPGGVFVAIGLLGLVRWHSARVAKQRAGAEMFSFSAANQSFDMDD